MFRTTIRILAILLAAQAVPLDCAAQDCSRVPSTAIFFGNGIFTFSRDEAYTTLDKISVNLAAHTDGMSDCFEYDIAYNASEYGVDFLESFQQLDSLYTSRLWKWIGGLELAPSWFQELAAQRAAELDAAAYVNDGDLAKQVGNYYSEILVNNTHVVVVAHSQGNLYANQAANVLESIGVPATFFSVVAVASPAGFVANTGPHVTQHGDIILAVPGRLAPNASNDPPCGEFPSVHCHSFDTYLGGNVTGPTILAGIMGFVSILPPVADFIIEAGGTQVRPGGTLRATTPTGTQLPIRFSGIADSDVQAFEWRMGGAVQSTEQSFELGLDHGRYEVSLVVADSDGKASEQPARAEIVITPPPPAGGFTGTVAGTPLASGESTEVRLTRLRDTALATFEASIVSEQPIAEWRWSINGEAVPGDRLMTTAFGVGRFRVRLVVVDEKGVESAPVEALITIMLEGTETTAVWEDSSLFVNSIAADSEGRLLLYGQEDLPLADVSISSINPDGRRNWKLPVVYRTDPLAHGGYLNANDQHMAIDPNNRVYVRGADTLIAIDPDGSVPSGWPVAFPSSFPGQDTEWLMSLPVFTTAGDVLISGPVFAGEQTFTFLHSLNNDGTTTWRREFPDRTSAWPVEGTQGRIFWITSDHQRNTTLMVTDPLTGTTICTWGPSPFITGPSVGNTYAAFGSVGGRNVSSSIFSYGAACEVQSVFNDPTQPALLIHGIVRGLLITTEARRNSQDVALTVVAIMPLAGSDTNDAAGFVAWRADRIGEAQVQTIDKGIVYTIGRDRDDGNKAKLFLIDAETGMILGSVATGPACLNCIVAARGSAVYLSEAGATRVFKVR